MQQFNAETVARVKRFLVLAVFENPNAAVGEHAVAIHQEQFDASGALLDLGRVHRLSHLEKFDARELQTRRGARQHHHGRALPRLAEFAGFDVNVRGDEVRI
jgi:hypothetical protein